MVAPALPPLNVESGRGSGRRRRTRRRGTRTPLLFPAPSSNPVAEVTEAVLELGMLAGDAGLLPPPDAVAVAVVVAAMSLSTLSRARPGPGLSVRGPWRVPRGAAFAASAWR
ncbi:hypothetical protein ACQJBY_005120 [Aegilops geniculata]